MAVPRDDSDEPSEVLPKALLSRPTDQVSEFERSADVIARAFHISHVQSPFDEEVDDVHQTIHDLLAENKRLKEDEERMQRDFEAVHGESVREMEKQDREQQQFQKDIAKALQHNDEKQHLKKIQRRINSLNHLAEGAEQEEEEAQE